MKKNLAKISHPGQGKLATLMKFGSFLLTKPGFGLLKKVIKKIFIKLGIKQDINIQYPQWIAARLDPKKLKEEFAEGYPKLQYKPVISIVIPIYNPMIAYLEAAINSVLEQSYTNWELCISDDVSPNAAIRKILAKYKLSDKRIKVIYREKNGHISANTNSALSLATGAYILFMDHDDMLTPNCLFEFVKHINNHPQDQVIYSDEDKINDNKQLSDPHFKPDWAPDNLLSRNYMGHVIVIQKDLMDQLKGLREGYEGSQDHDLLLRATELTEHIGHIPKVLYHWRIHELSVANPGGDVKPYAFTAAKRALEDAMVRRGTPAKVEDVPDTIGAYRIKYELKSAGKVSVIIPTKDQVVLLKIAIDSILNRTDYPDYEIILLDNNSETPDFFSLVEEYEAAYPEKFRCVTASFTFNFAKLMNLGVAESKGEYVLMCNNDVEVIHNDWMREMASYAQRAKTGAVGVKLLYKDDTVQHAGVVLGLGGAAGHVFVNMQRQERGYFNYMRMINNYAAVTGACLMCKKSVYLEVGGMDEQLEVEYNDIDLCLKFLTHGYFNVYLPTVELYHYESASRGHPFQSKESWAQHEKDFAKFGKKWQPLIDNDPFYSPNLAIDCTDFRINFAGPR